MAGAARRQIGVGLILFTIGARLIPAAKIALISLLEVVLGPLWVWLAMGSGRGLPPRSAVPSWLRQWSFRRAIDPAGAAMVPARRDPPKPNTRPSERAKCLVTGGRLVQSIIISASRTQASATTRDPRSTHVAAHVRSPMSHSWRISALADRHPALGSQLENRNGIGTAWTYTTPLADAYEAIRTRPG